NVVVVILKVRVISVPTGNPEFEIESPHQQDELHGVEAAPRTWAALSARSALMAPAPSFKSPCPLTMIEGPSILWVAEAIIIARSASGHRFSPAFRSIRRAAKPATCGAAKLVPETVRTTLAPANAVTFTPAATISGFSRSVYGLVGFVYDELMLIWSPDQSVSLLSS